MLRESLGAASIPPRPEVWQQIERGMRRPRRPWFWLSADSLLALGLLASAVLALVPLDRAALAAGLPAPRPLPPEASEAPPLLQARSPEPSAGAAQLPARRPVLHAAVRSVEGVLRLQAAPPPAGPELPPDAALRSEVPAGRAPAQPGVLPLGPRSTALLPHSTAIRPRITVPQGTETGWRPGRKWNLYVSAVRFRGAASASAAAALNDAESGSLRFAFNALEYGPADPSTAGDAPDRLYALNVPVRFTAFEVGAERMVRPRLGLGFGLRIQTTEQSEYRSGYVSQLGQDVSLNYLIQAGYQGVVFQLDAPYSLVQFGTPLKARSVLMSRGKWSAFAEGSLIPQANMALIRLGGITPGSGGAAESATVASFKYAIQTENSREELLRLRAFGLASEASFQVAFDLTPETSISIGPAVQYTFRKPFGGTAAETMPRFFLGGTAGLRFHRVR